MRARLSRARKYRKALRTLGGDGPPRLEGAPVLAVSRDAAKPPPVNYHPPPLLAERGAYRLVYTVAALTRTGLHDRAADLPASAPLADLFDLVRCTSKQFQGYMSRAALLVTEGREYGLAVHSRRWHAPGCALPPVPDMGLLAFEDQVTDHAGDDVPTRQAKAQTRLRLQQVGLEVRRDAPHAPSFLQCRECGSRLCDYFTGAPCGDAEAHTVEALKVDEPLRVVHAGNCEHVLELTRVELCDQARPFGVSHQLKSSYIWCQRCSVSVNVCPAEVLDADELPVCRACAEGECGDRRSNQDVSHKGNKLLKSADAGPVSKRHSEIVMAAVRRTVGDAPDLPAGFSWKALAEEVRPLGVRRRPDQLAEHVNHLMHPGKVIEGEAERQFIADFMHAWRGGRRRQGLPFAQCAREMRDLGMRRADGAAYSDKDVSKTFRSK